MHKRKEPILVTVQRGQGFYFSGEQWQSAKIFSGISPKSLVRCSLPMLAHKMKKKTLESIVNMFYNLAMFWQSPETLVSVSIWQLP